MSFAALVADIGGTNTRVAWVEQGKVQRAHIQSFKNSEFDSFDDILAQVFTQHKAMSLCIALAGPVEGKTGEMTNLNWQFDADAISKRWNLGRCELLNDLQAQGWGAPFCADDQRKTILVGEKRPDATTLVLGVGTGCNIAVNHPASHGRVVPAAEAGHIDFPVKCAQDYEYLQYLQTSGRETSLEGLLSGRGLLGCYAYFANAEAQGPAEIIAMAQESRGNDAARAIQFMRRKLGDVLGDLALSHLPFGGIYLIGGVARSLASFDDDILASAFVNKGRFEQFMTQFNVEVIEDDFAALEGAAAYLRQLA